MYLLIISFMIAASGQRGVSLAQFNTQADCVQAMIAVSNEAPGVTATCKEIQRGN